MQEKSHSSGERKFGQQVAQAGVGNHPVEQPDAAQVDQDEHGADHQREYGDCFGSTGNGVAPTCVGHPKDGGDQRTGVADADPEDKVDDVDAPHHPLVDARNPHAGRRLVGESHQGPGHHQAQQDDDDPEPGRGFEKRTQQVGVDPPAFIDGAERFCAGIRIALLHQACLSSRRVSGK